MIFKKNAQNEYGEIFQEKDISNRNEQKEQGRFYSLSVILDPDLLFAL